MDGFVYMLISCSHENNTGMSIYTHTHTLPFSQPKIPIYAKEKLHACIYKSKIFSWSIISLFWHVYGCRQWKKIEYGHVVLWKFKLILVIYFHQNTRRLRPWGSKSSWIPWSWHEKHIYLWRGKRDGVNYSKYIFMNSLVLTWKAYISSWIPWSWHEKHIYLWRGKK
jgi:hypothetical protein